MPEEQEWKTRKERIDKKLKALTPVWTIVKHHAGLNTAALHCHAVEEYPTANGPADYALFVKGKPLGIIEAKKVSVSPQNVLERAKCYAKGAFDGSRSWNGYKVSFLYATNGEVIWYIDIRNEKNISRYR
ncbi:MAG: type I restriction endonuclease [Pseudomonadota bacterium]